MSAQSDTAAALVTVISQDGLNLRSNPNTSSTVLITIPFATVLTLTGAPTADNWYPVSYGSFSGWALGDYLTAGEADPLTAQSAPPLTAAAGISLGLGAAAPAPAAATVVSSLSPSGPAMPATLPSGTSYGATASYYGIDDGAVPGQIMACGSPFDPMNAGAVSTNDWPCGTHLRVTGPGGNAIEVVVTDHGQYPSHWFDLTYAAFAKLADHKLGTIHVTVSVVP